jgi:hypothetical protein
MSVRQKAEGPVSRALGNAQMLDAYGQAPAVIAAPGPAFL